MIGFYIKELRVTGDGLEDAVIELEKGLNVINGPSNTGKSYIFKCIDYMFGASELKVIPESKGYKKVYLEIRSFKSDSPITILRLIGKNDIFYAHTDIRNFNTEAHHKLKSKHNANFEDNISKFLLNQIGIREKKVLVTNQDGKKKTLGFRGIVNLSLVSETDIISEEKSPIFDGVNTNETYCKSVFRYLLTLIDDVMCEEIEKDEIRKAKIDAKIEYINSDIKKMLQDKDQLQEHIENKLNEFISIDDYAEQVTSIEGKIREKRKILKAVTTKQNNLNFQKNKMSLMLEKFYVLKSQYESDLLRLNFVQDGDDCLNQIPTNHCPLCNNKVSIKTFNEENSNNIIEACNHEETKTKIHLLELAKTINATISEIDAITNRSNDCENDIVILKEEIDKILTNELNPLKGIIATSVNYSNLVSRLQDIVVRINNKKREITGFDESKKQQRPKLNYDISVQKSIYDELCEEIKNTLINWAYKDIKSVTFDAAKQDVVINNSGRKTNGKGFRAFFYAAFSVSLMNYLLSKEHPYTRILVLDSPVTTLKEDEIDKGNINEDDMIDSSLQDALFVTLSKEPLNKQIIILENKELPQQIEGKCNHIKFTKGKSKGRYGFFPLSVE